MNKFESAFQKEMNSTYTENGALSNKSTLNYLLDFFSQAGAMRNRSEGEILEVWHKAMIENKELAFRLLFYFRDVRAGQGERRLFKIIFEYLCEYYPEDASRIISLVPFYGRWDDLFVGIGTPTEVEIVTFIKKTFESDRAAFLRGGEISLLAKWLPSVSTHGKKKPLAKFFIKAFSMNEAFYRKTLSRLRKQLELVESKMSDNRWDEINYSKVPSQAMSKLYSAFYRNDGERFEEFLNEVEEGTKEIKAGTLYPYQLVKKAMQNKGDTVKSLNAQWKALPEFCEEYDNTMVIVDVSGSMTMGAGDIQPIFMSIGLGLYLAERNTGFFKNKFMTFSSNPELVDVIGNNLWEKVSFMNQANWGGSTNLQASFDMILSAAVKNNVPQSDMPKRMIIISDMEFDSGTGIYWGREAKDDFDKTNRSLIAEKYNRAGYELPELVWWNVDARNPQYPMTKNEVGLMVSGNSPEIMKSVIKDEIITPEQIMMDVAQRERYDLVSQHLGYFEKI